MSSTNGDGGGGGRLGKLKHRFRQFLQRGDRSELEGFRRLAFQLHHGLPRGEARRSVLVVTPRDSETSARGSATLAFCMAEELRRPILLADSTEDWQVSRLLGSPESEGLTDFLIDPERSIDELAIATSQENVSFLPRGTRDDASGASPEHVNSLLQQTEARWDFTVVAGGGVLTNGLSLAMAPKVGQVLLLITEHHTHLDDIEAAQNTLRLCHAPNVSLVLTERSAAIG